MKPFLLGAASLAVLAACTPPAAQEDVTATSAAGAPVVAEFDPLVPNAEGKYVNAEGLELTSADYWGDWGINLTYVKDSVHPGDDFFDYVNGEWQDNFDMPADRTRYGSFDLLSEKSEQRVKRIIDDLAASSPPLDTLEGKIGAIYNAFLDTDAIEAAGLAPAQPYLDRIAAIDTREELARVFADTGYTMPMGGWVDIDARQTDQYIFYLTQGGLGMGDRDYYLEDSEKNLELRAAYKDMLTFLLGEAGYDNPEAEADSVIALETTIAKAHWDRAVGRNRNLTYNKLTLDELRTLAGDFPLDTLLAGIGLDGQAEFVARQITPTAEEIEENGLTPEQVEKISGGGLEALFAIMQDVPLEQWKPYLTAHFLIDRSNVLPERFDTAMFKFYGTALRGQEEQRERWKRSVVAVEQGLGEGLGKVYAERYFPAENKAEMDKLVANLRAALASNLAGLEWMGAETKVEAYDKLDKFTPKIGYPEKFETYDDLVVSSDAFANSMAISAWRTHDMLSKLGQPIDKTEWFMNPQTVNAYYSPNRNEIVFPAAILQPPFFNLSADPAVNYGAIGGVIGHEIGHGFDDQGSKSDGDGVLRNWWTDEDQANFKARTQELVEQYNKMCPLDDGETCVNGALTLGENIGDLGGLSMAYTAYKLSLNGEEAPVLDGYTGDQRFFMAWAQVWRSKYRDEALRRQIQTDPHAPVEYRVNVVVRNMDAWYEAFDIGPDHALYLPPEERVGIW